MTNDALETIVTALCRVSRLRSTFEHYAGLVDLDTVGQSNERLTQLVHGETELSEAGIQSALDRVDGEALTALDTALDEVRKTRREYDRAAAGAAARASRHACRARDLVLLALRVVHAEDQATR